MRKQIYAIGDIHGRLDLLEAVLEKIDHDCVAMRIDEPTLVFLGDYIDRGPNSAQVIEKMIELCRHSNVVALKGNHEEVFLKILSGSYEYFKGWYERVGGRHTLTSYGWGGGDLDLKALVPNAHIEFMQNLKLYWETEDAIFVHAGLRPGYALSEQSDKDMLWIRDDFLESDFDFGRLVVHGHTPTDDGRHDLRANRLNLDAKSYQSGTLSCAAFEPGDRHPRILSVSIEPEMAIPKI